MTDLSSPAQRESTGRAERLIGQADLRARAVFFAGAFLAAAFFAAAFFAGRFLAGFAAPSVRPRRSARRRRPRAQPAEGWRLRASFAAATLASSAAMRSMTLSSSAAAGASVSDLGALGLPLDQVEHLLAVGVVVALGLEVVGQRRR